ncbi:MAG: glycosyl hydrolase, partial [Mycobacteriales bacterium]
PNEEGYYGFGAAAEAKDIRSWRHYVRTLAIRYQGKINKWELYNEPNAKLMFSGTPKVMAAMAREAWIQLKTIDPANVVVSPGIVTRTTNSPKWLDEYLNAGGARYADAITAHFYVKAGERPEDTLRYLAIVRKIMADRGVGHLPLWNTESGYGRWNPQDRRTHEIYGGSTSMAYVARTYVLMAASNVVRSYWYGWDQREFTGLFLTTNGYTAGPAGRAYGVMSGWLVGSRVHSCTVVMTGAIAGGYSCVVTKGRVQRRILWHPTRSATLRIPAGYRSQHNLDGTKVVVRSGTPFTVGPVPVLISTSP